MSKVKVIQQPDPNFGDITVISLKCFMVSDLSWWGLLITQNPALVFGIHKCIVYKIKFEILTSLFTSAPTEQLCYRNYFVLLIINNNFLNAHIQIIISNLCSDYKFLHFQNLRLKAEVKDTPSCISLLNFSKNDLKRKSYNMCWNE